ncbi:MAG TPA: hypothetical protein VMM15_29035 [Bradyrhizobium sp.]|nr:hypothetical protein [Bradyrhizobium sp.]
MSNGGCQRTLLASAALKGKSKPSTGDRNVVCAFENQKPFAAIPQKPIGGFDFQVTLCTDGASDKVTSVALSRAVPGDASRPRHQFCVSSLAAWQEEVDDGNDGQRHQRDEDEPFSLRNVFKRHPLSPDGTVIPSSP